MWVLAIWACSPEGGLGTPESHPQEWDGDFLIDDVIIDCDGYYNWNYDVWTQGWGDLITVDVVVREFGAVVWTEHHQLTELDWGDDWAHFAIELDQVRDTEDYADNQSVFVPCESKTTVTYGFAAWRYDGEMEECIAYGVDPENEFPDCANWGTVTH